MTVEDEIIRQIDMRKRATKAASAEKRFERKEVIPVIERAHTRAKQIFCDRAYAIQAPDFFSVYGEKAVKADMLEVIARRKRWNEKHTDYDRVTDQMSTVLEAVILVHSKKSDWLGGANTKKTSSWDDYENKTDMFAEWFSPKSGSLPLALAVDVTFGKLGVANKLSAIRKEIDSGELGSIKYFQDERGDFKGTRYNVPRTVVGVSTQVLETLANLWMRNDDAALKDHPIQTLIMNEIYTQLVAMRAYAETQGKSKVVAAYEQAIAVMEQLRDKKVKVPLNNLAFDRIGNEIIQQTAQIFKR